MHGHLIKPAFYCLAKHAGILGIFFLEYFNLAGGCASLCVCLDASLPELLPLLKQRMCLHARMSVYPPLLPELLFLITLGVCVCLPASSLRMRRILRDVCFKIAT